MVISSPLIKPSKHTYLPTQTTEGLVGYCMASREEGGLEIALAKADAVTGISFKTSFSFAVTAHLLKVQNNPFIALWS